MVDPDREVQKYLDAAAGRGLTITHIIETHLHADHVSGNTDLAARIGAKIYLHEASGAQFAHEVVHDGDVLELGNLRLKVLHTPGHTPESITLLVADTIRAEQPWPAPDREALRDTRFADGILSVTRDAILNSVTGWVNEELLMASPWGFDLQEISCPDIYLWHGEMDKNVPVAMGKAVAERLSGCHSFFLEGEGHLSLLYNHGSEIIDTLVQMGGNRK